MDISYFYSCVVWVGFYALLFSKVDDWIFAAMVKMTEAHMEMNGK